MLKSRLRGLAGLSASLLFAAGTAMLTGCGAGMITAAEDSAGPQVTLDGVHIHGNVHGGLFPIQGANIELWQTGVGAWNTTTNSYAPSFLNGTSNPNFIASTTSAKAGDSTGLAPGYFAFSNSSFTCTAGNYLYLTTTGGGTIPTKTNASVVQIGVIGVCPAGGSAADTAYLSNVNVYLSELSTVAAAYTLANFISVDTDPVTSLQRVNITAPVVDNANSVTAAFTRNPVTAGCTGLGSSMSCNAGGLGNGFSNALNLVDSLKTDNSFPSGRANLSLPGNAHAIAPAAMINTIGDILQSCVDSGPSSASSPSTACSRLFGYSPLSSSSATPKNSLQVALNLARNPSPSPSSTPTGAQNLFGLVAQNGPFGPPLGAAPAAYTVSILYPAAALGDSTFSSPVDVALDDLDNVFVAYTQQGGSGALAGTSASGSSLFSGAKPPATALDILVNPATLSVDPNGVVWVADDTAKTMNANAGNVTGFTAAGAYSTFKVVPYGNASAIAFDNSNNMFAARDSADGHFSAYSFLGGSRSYSQDGSARNLTMRRAAVDSYGSFKAVGGGTFLTWAPEPCTYTTTYAESSVTLDNSSGKAFAIDNNIYTDTRSNYNSFFVLNGQISTGNVVPASNQTCWTATSTVNNYSGKTTSSSTGADGAALDGTGNLFWTTGGGQLYTIAGIETEEINQSYTGSTALTPCFLVSASANTCTAPSSLAGMAIDSSGAMWVTSPNTSGSSYLVQTFGLAGPTWPLLAYEKSGVPVK